jgi:hypothetical protein
VAADSYYAYGAIGTTTIGCAINGFLPHLHTHKRWNMGLVLAIFVEEEVKAISIIPLSPLQPQDQLVWSGTSNGLFSVQSAYHMGKEIQP